MKYHSLLLLLTPCLMTLNPALSQDTKALQKNNGFKKYKLNTAYTPLYGMKAKDTSGAEKVAVSYTEDKIGDIAVDRIELFYISNNLAAIKVNVSAYNYQKLLDACKASFGEPTSNASLNRAAEQKDSTLHITGKTYRDKYIWKGSTISLEYVYQYPKTNGDVYATKDLYLLYRVNDYDQRLKKVNSKKYSTSDF